jgi:excisionase family DNA binding protein
MSIPEVMDVREAADYLGVSSDTLYKYLSSGQIPAFRLGSRWRFKKTVLDQWMESQSHLGAGAEGLAVETRLGARVGERRGQD